MVRYGRTYKETEISTSKIAQQERDDLMEDMDALLLRRTYNINRLELDLMEVYEKCIPDNIAQAMETLLNDPFWKRALNKSSANQHAQLLIAAGETYPGTDNLMGSVTFECSRPVPSVYYQYTDSRVVLNDIPERKVLLDYCRKQSRVHNENAYARATIRQFLTRCNTWGQTVRLWPSFTNYIIHEGKRARVERQVKSSPLPEYYKEYPEALHQIKYRLMLTEQVLVQALMLPERSTAPKWYFVSSYGGTDTKVEQD